MLFVSFDVSPFFPLLSQSAPDDRTSRRGLFGIALSKRLTMFSLFNFPILFSECVTHLHLKRKPFFFSVLVDGTRQFYFSWKRCVRALKDSQKGILNKIRHVLCCVVVHIAVAWTVEKEEREKKEDMEIVDGPATR